MSRRAWSRENAEPRGDRCGLLWRASCIWSMWVICPASVTIRARPSPMSWWGPVLAALVTGPGIAPTLRPKSYACRAVCSAPERTPASTTIVVFDRAARSRLRARNRCRVGVAPGGVSLTAPRRRSGRTGRGALRGRGGRRHRRGRRSCPHRRPERRGGRRTRSRTRRRRRPPARRVLDRWRSPRRRARRMRSPLVSR